MLQGNAMANTNVGWSAPSPASDGGKIGSRRYLPGVIPCPDVVKDLIGLAPWVGCPKYLFPSVVWLISTIRLERNRNIPRDGQGLK